MTQPLRTDSDEIRNVFRAFLVGTFQPPESVSEAKECLAELAELVRTLEVPVAGEAVAQIRTANPKYFVGSGKAEEIRDAAKDAGANVIVFDAALGPTQQRNLESLCEMKVIDRQEVILDFFARRARTREATLQVDLARCRYFLPRLTGAWTHLSRQRGGNTGARGAGEKQIEYDRRQLKERIAVLEDELAEVRKRRDVQRKSRMRARIPSAALAGYTNAGKSTLLNLLTNSDIFAADQVFATLDPTTRQMELPDKSRLLLTDTVGFVRRLPHSLIEAFRSTLEEAILADFIILVLDASNPAVFAHLETTQSVLSELGADRKSILFVCNKCDRIEDPVVRIKLRASLPEAVFVSCRTGEGIDDLKNALLARAGAQTEMMELAIPPERSELIALLHEKTRILDASYLDDGAYSAVAVVSNRLAERFRPYRRTRSERNAQTAS